MRITSKGRVTIPAEIREKAGLLPNTEVEFEFDGTSVRIVRAEPVQASGCGRTVVEKLRGRASVKMSTDEILGMTRG